ncbi:MAG: hypothetical protein GY757_05780, partial [bacterium]|nr:hypothetical protein [bacterium]
MKRIIIVTVAFIVFLQVSSILYGAIPASERAALIALYNATDGDNWRSNTNWKSNNNEADGFAAFGTEGTWYGITVSDDHVIRISLNNNLLTGHLPAELGNLSNLENLNLRSDFLSGSIPPELGNLSNLAELSLYSSQLSGSIPPELGNLSSLAELSLYSSQLSGSIPAELGNLSNLESLTLSSNSLSGSIPPELGNLSNLIYLILSESQLTGSIPPELGNLRNLNCLALSNNQLSGSIPPELGELNNLISLVFKKNQLSGSIPAELAKLSNLTYLYLGDNQLSGSIPPELGELNNLTFLAFEKNQLSGSIPAEFAKLSNLTDLYLGENQLSGNIPTELGNLSNLTVLSLGDNQLSGSIPTELGNLSNLRGFFLHFNQLSGSIPAGLGNLSRLSYLYLASNRLSGSIPSELGNLINIIGLDLNDNQLSGRIPPELGNLSGILNLYLNDNQLSSNIPAELSNLNEMWILDLSSNQLSGKIPPELGYLCDLRQLSLKGNQLSGSIPTSFRQLDLIACDIGYNALYTSDSRLRSFLLREDPDWESTQTIAPSNVTAVVLSSDSVRLAWISIPYTDDDGGYNVFYGTTSSGPWTQLGITTDKTVSSYDISGLNAGTTYYFVVTTQTYPHGSNNNTLVSKYSNETTTIPGNQVQIALPKSRLDFAYVISGDAVSPQTFNIESDCVITWAAAADVPWLSLSPASGLSTGIVTVSVDPTGLDAGEYTGNISVTAYASNSPQILPVYLRVYVSGETSEPFGNFSTPADNSTVMSSIPVTGWALDDVGVESVKIYREDGGTLYYIGDASFVEGARPDVEQNYPGYPDNSRAGWGYMLLTYFLPDGGNGTFTLHAMATDNEGNIATLGTKTITVDNANAVNPFGAIDTPDQGGTASGKFYRSHGWVLTPQPNKVPIDGATINVYVDGVYLGHTAYCYPRSDIAGLFPGYNNSDRAAAYFDINTYAFSNGVHQLYWTATDDAGNADGIGSRYFTINNSGADQAGQAMKAIPFSLKQMEKIRVDLFADILVSKGYGKNSRVVPTEKNGEPVISAEKNGEFVISAGKNGEFKLELKELERVVLNLNTTGDSCNVSGYMKVGKQLKS